MPKDYPSSPPEVKFVAPKIAMSGVDSTGKVNPAALSPPLKWDSSMNIADILMAIRTAMEDDQVNKDSAGLGNSSY